MLYTIGTEKELSQIEDKLPSDVFKALFKSTVLLGYAYGPNRSYRESGGYSLIAETADDVEAMRNAVDFTTHPCEWADRIGKYLSALFLLNDDFSVVLFIPLAVAPEILLQELEETT